MIKAACWAKSKPPRQPEQDLGIIRRIRSIDSSSRNAALELTLEQSLQAHGGGGKALTEQLI